MSDDEDEYKVGYRRPPLETRWKKGCPSPNPTGRRKKDLRGALVRDLTEALQEPVRARSGGAEVTLSLSKAAFRQIVNNAIRGDNAATAHVLTAARALPELVEAEQAQANRKEDSIRKFLALVIDDPEEQHRAFEEYYANKKRRKRT